MDEEIKKRIDDFVKEYGELVEKHKIDFANYPVYVPDENGGFRVVIQNTPVDITNMAIKSPFVPQ